MQQDLRTLEERVRERTRELEEARAVAALLEAQVRHQEKMAGLGVLAAGFAHDMGNPLASLSTELEMLEGETDVARFRESLDVLRRHVARMSRTLREMVDFARRRREEVTDVSIASAVADSARLVLHDPRWQKVKLAVDVPADLPPVRMVDDHLVLVLVNLMINAGDAMVDGGTLTVSARTRGAFVDLRVRDTGHGMSPDVLAKVKAPLFTTKTGGRGTGLGLAVCDNVVRSVGGEMAITSAPGLGTEVAISLPTAAGGADA
jgi:signal transduction histidine kinase